MLRTDSDLTLCQQPTGLISMTLQFAFTVHADLQSPNYVALLSRQDRDVAFSILHMSCLLAHYTHTWTPAHSSLFKSSHSHSQIQKLSHNQDYIFYFLNTPYHILNRSLPQPTSNASFLALI